MNILLAENARAPALVTMLEPLGHAVTAVAADEAFDAWRHGNYQVVIAGIEGMALCRRIRAEQRPGYTCLLLIAAPDQKALYMEGIDAGADDFIVGPFDVEFIAARLRIAERTVALHDTLHGHAMLDPQTGLINRAALVDTLQQEIKRAARGGARVGVMVAELDQLDEINQRHGRAVGDQVVREAARRIQSALRSYDRVGRHGGDDFVIVASGASLLQTHGVAQRICANVRASAVETASGPFAMTMSMGVAISRSDPAETAPTLIAAAREALLRAQQAGRNRVEMADRAERR